MKTESRKVNVIIGKAHNTQKGASKNYKISLPNTWTNSLGINEYNREMIISFDGKRIVIEPKKTPDSFAKEKAECGHIVKILRLYDNNNLATVIAADYTEKTICVENHTDIPIKRAFGKNETPTWEDYQNFLSERCVPQTRAGLKEYLDSLEISEYDPLEIIKKTKGKMAEDNQWIEIEEVKGNEYKTCHG